MAAHEVLRLGVIGIGPSNMASTLVMLRKVADLRYEITAAGAAAWESVKTGNAVRVDNDFDHP